MTSNRHLDQRLKVQHFHAVDAIAAHGSLLKAATALSVTQPALSKSVRDVEDILGLKVFERNPRGVAPTAAGVAFVESARRLLAELRRLDETLDVSSDPSRSGIVLGVLPVTASGVLPGVLARMKGIEPDIRIRIARRVDLERRQAADARRACLCRSPARLCRKPRPARDTRADVVGSPSAQNR